MQRFINAFKMFYWAIANPQVMQVHNFKMLSGLLELILKVANENRPYATKLAMVHPDPKEPDLEVVSIWAGAGRGADPMKRIEELLEENSKLREENLELIARSNNSEFTGFGDY
jgi:hypothetical protein